MNKAAVILNKLALWWLSRGMRRNHSWAWSWHCNMACAAMDEGVSPDKANHAAARFMRAAFGVDTTKGPQ